MTSTLQKFKSFDKAFTRQQIDECRGRHRVIGVDVSSIKYWAHGYVQPDQADVQYAVYKAEDFMRWQLFRVSMKGLVTQQKLRMLYVRWERYNCDIVDYGKLRVMPQAEREHWMRANSILEWIRINNYIGALVRGGQLDKTLRIVS